MIAWFLERGGLLLGPHGWSRDAGGAMRFASESDARDGLADMRRTTPRLMSGDVRAVSHEWEPPALPGQVKHEYDPFGVRP